MTERLEKFLKEAKIKLMIGGIIGSVALGGGSIVKAQAANNQNNTKSISTEASYDGSVNGIVLDDEIKDGLVISHSSGNKIRVGNLENLDLDSDKEYVYDVYLFDDSGIKNKLVSQGLPIKDEFTATEEGLYYLVIKEKNTNEIYGVTTSTSKSSESSIKNFGIRMGYDSTNFMHYISIPFEELPNEVEYVYDLYMVDDIGNIIKQAYKDMPSNKFSFVKENGKYCAIIKEKGTGTIYGKTPAIDTKICSTFLQRTVNAGGVNSHLYEEIASSISDQIGIEYQTVLDTIVYLYRDKIDETQISVLYPNGIDSKKLNQSTDEFLSSVLHCDFRLSDLATDEKDIAVLSVIDSKVISMRETLDPTEHGYNELKQITDFFVNGGEINGYTFNQLSNVGKTLALVNYQRIDYEFYKLHQECSTNGGAWFEGYDDLYQKVGILDTYYIANKLNANYLISKYNNFLIAALDCLEELNEYSAGNLSLQDAVKIGGVTSHLYNGIALGISIESGMNFEEVKDYIVSHNFNKIDETQIPILYPNGIDSNWVNINTDSLLMQLLNNDFKTSKLVANEQDIAVLSVIDDKSFEMKNTLDQTEEHYNELKQITDFFLAGGKINGYTFGQLSDSGKQLALVGYQKVRNEFEKLYQECSVNELGWYEEYEDLYKMVSSMDILTVSTHLNSSKLISNNFNFVRKCVASNNSNSLDKDFSGSNEKTETLTITTIISRLFNPENTEKAVAKLENIHQHLDNVVVHNSTHKVSEHISLIETLNNREIDQYEIAQMESFYKVLKYEMENNNINEQKISAILAWVNDYYTGTYLNHGKEMRYVEKLSSEGILVANSVLNQYKVLVKGLKVQSPGLKILIDTVERIDLYDFTKGANQELLSQYEKIEYEKSLYYYTVVKGDTLWKIAQKYGMTAQQLYDLNRDIIGDNPNLILPGQELKTNLTYNYDQPTR